MGVLGTVAKLYVGYGLAHTIFNILRQLLQKKRMWKLLEGIPRGKYKEDKVLGMVPQLLENLHRRHDFFDDISKGMPLAVCEMGPKFDINNMMVFVKDPVVIKHFLKDNYEGYTKPTSETDVFFHHLRIWLGDGIFVARHGADAIDKGANWHSQRKIAASIFNRGNFNSNMSEIFVAKGHRFCEALRQPALVGEAVDMQAKFFQYTMDSIMQIFFGEKADTLGGENNEYALAYDSAHRNLIEYVFKSMAFLGITNMLPWPFGGYDGLAAKARRNMNPLFQEFGKSLKILDRESRRIVDEARVDKQLAERKDLLAMFLHAEEKGGEKFTAEWLRDVVLNFIIAGRDTTACTLTWMFYILATHPEIQAKVQAEVDGRFSGDSVPTYTTVSANELPYLTGVLYETLRLYPPVPVDGKTAVADDVLPSGQKIPKGASLNFMVYCMGRDAEVYPDPLVVKPERWIPFKEPSPYAFPVFQAGPRICLGMNMALFEAKIVAVMLLRQYTFTMAPGEAEKVSYLPTALTMSLVNSKKANGENNFDTHNLWLIPHVRNGA